MAFTVNMIAWADVEEDMMWAVRVFAATHATHDGGSLDEAWWDAAEAARPPDVAEGGQWRYSDRGMAFGNILDLDLEQPNGMGSLPIMFVPFRFEVAGQDPPHWTTLRTTSGATLALCSPDALRDDPPESELDPDDDDEDDIKADREYLEFAGMLHRLFRLAWSVRLPVVVHW